MDAVGSPGHDWLGASHPVRQRAGACNRSDPVAAGVSTFGANPTKEPDD